MSFKDDLIKDLSTSFLSENDFGEKVTLVRKGERIEILGLYDEPSLDGQSIGAEVDAISHRPRLFVSSASLPDGKPAKGDKFILSSTPFHKAMTLSARDFAFEKDGVIVYDLQVVR